MKNDSLDGTMETNKKPHLIAALIAAVLLGLVIGGLFVAYVESIDPSVSNVQISSCQDVDVSYTDDLLFITVSGAGNPIVSGKIAKIDCVSHPNQGITVRETIFRK